jgi:hypothetical protein
MLGICCDVTVGDVELRVPLVLVGAGPGRKPNLGNSNWKLTSLGLFTP